MTDPTGTVSFQYDDQDRLVQMVQADGQALGYDYDAEGNRTALHAPGGTTAYAHDALGRVTSLTDPQGGVTTWSYDALGNPTGRVQPNGVATTITRDLRNRLTGIEARAPNGTLLASYAYTLDLAGNRTSVTEHTGRSATWQYDALYRLLNETVQEPGQPTTSESFAYDPVGNRTTQTNAQGTFPHTYDANDRLLSDGRATYTWDPNGNLQSKTDALGTTSYAWDARDRLVEVQGPTTGLVEHAYDGRGQRVTTWTDGVPASYLVDDNRALSQVIEERDGFGGLIAAYVHGPQGEPLARYDGAATTTADFHHDGQGSVRLLTDATAAVTDAYAYSAFGELVSASGASANPYRYGGQWEEPRTGLYHLRARWMDPAQGRFLSTDPFAGFQRQPVSMHRYLYANANPVTMHDPSGRVTLAQVGATVQIAGTLASIAIPTYTAFRDLQAGASLGEVTQQLAYDAAMGVAFSAVGGGILRFAPRLLKIRPRGWSVPVGGRASRSVWNLGNHARGEAIERLILARPRTLPWNYPVIDDFAGGIAHSIKSIDLTAASRGASSVKSLIRGAARDLDEFVPRNWGTARLANQPVNGRLLTVAFERGASDRVQAKALAEIASEIGDNFPNVRLVFKWIE